jgi:fumarate reductase flavoprotein subunit
MEISRHNPLADSKTRVALPPAEGFPYTTQLLVVGAGACGLTAALSASDAGLECLVLERDESPTGSTSLSSGLIPACGTAAQQRLEIEDSTMLMAQDIQNKAHGEAPQNLVDAVVQASGPTIDWLTKSHDIALSVVEGFLYPGHSVARMHGPPSRTGAELLAALLNRAGELDPSVVTNSQVTRLFANDEGRVVGVEIGRPDGITESIGCEYLLLACNGYGGDPALVNAFIPEMAGAQYFGHPGNTGDALRWGTALEASLDCLGAYQGHGSVATPHQILITWALMMEGGIQVNKNGERFSNEHDGYSEQAVRVLAQPDGIAWNIFDERLANIASQFDDYREAVSQGAVIVAHSASDLAMRTGIPQATLEASIACTHGAGRTADGRDFSITPNLVAPYYAVKVSGALFHTQGGLRVDGNARVLRADNTPLPNLYAGGGAACGVSGNAVYGYLSGNGLLSAVTLGRLAALDVIRRRGEAD